MSQTGEQYYASAANYGDYQFVELDSLVDSIYLEALEEEDHYLRNTKKFLLQKYGKEAVRELNFDVNGKVRPILFVLNNSLQVILPQDYVDYVRVSVIDNDGYAVPLNVNPNANIAKTYVLDNDEAIVFDDAGYPVEVRGSQSAGFPIVVIHRDYWGGYFQKDFSQYSANGEFAIDKESGIIQFSSNLSGASIVLEYISDGLGQDDIQGQNIRVHKYLAQAVMDLIYLKAIDRRRNVPDREKQRALNRFNKTKHKAKMYRANFNLEEFRKAMSSMHKWVKF